MEVTKESGIYEIINTVNNKRYIGQAKNIKFRIRTHFYNLRLNKHYNPHLQTAFNKYGENAFKSNAIVIISNPNTDILDEIEELLFSTYNFEDELYNILKFAKIKTTLKCNDEQKQNINTWKDKQKRSITQYDIVTLQVIRTYESVSEAAKFNNMNSEGIRGCVRGLQQTYKGYIWKFSNDNSEEIINFNKLKIREVFQIDAKTDEVICMFESISAASRAINCSISPIHRAVNNQQPTAGGYKWRYRVPK